MSIRCVNDTPYSFPRLPEDLLISDYMTNITRVTLASPMSVLPEYLCSLPSRVIDLSFQQFTTLTPATFPCLDYFRTVNLASNMMTSVNMPSGNFTNLLSLDLSSNSLTSIPSSILRPSPSSLSFLDLRYNSITAIDLLLYTLRNITVNLDGNPINNQTIVNPSNITVPAISANDTGSRANLTLPPTAAAQPLILNDAAISTARVCTSAGVEAYIALTGFSNASIRLDCTCASISLKVLYESNGTRITDRFTCTNGTSAVNFTALTLSSCPNALNLTVGCLDPTLIVSSLIAVTW